MIRIPGVNLSRLTNIVVATVYASVKFARGLTHSFSLSPENRGASSNTIIHVVSAGKRRIEFSSDFPDTLARARV